MKIKYPVRPSPVIPRVLLEVTSSLRFPCLPRSSQCWRGSNAHSASTSEDRPSHLSCFKGSVSFAARSYFRPLDIGAIVFDVRATVDFPSNILLCRVITLWVLSCLPATATGRPLRYDIDMTGC